MLFEIADADVTARATAARGSDVLAVVFSQVRVPAGRFGLSRLFARTAHACLFLNQPDNAWYRGAEAAVDAAIARAVDAVRPARVVLYGSSMGAWGALSAAARRPDAEAVAFAPDFSVGEPGGRSAEAGLAPVDGEPDLSALLAAPRRGTIDLVIGLYDPYDAGVAARLVDIGLPAAVRLSTVASGHEVHDHLYSLNVIRRVIAGFVRPIGAEAVAKGLALPIGDTGRRHALARLALDLGAGRTVDPAAVAAVAFSGDPGAALVEAEALAAAGRIDEAERRLARLGVEIAASPILSSLPKRFRKEVPRRRIALLDALGRTDDARIVAAEAAAAFPTDDGFAARAGFAPPDEVPGGADLT
ncbi:hypothetical protein [Oharaeibacter diazotrophicus]|uniref:Alpha/beta hydrolase family protein n=2 Tax=Oharaeibacter diazotrophicus TaxID=1920512 RepID=A0A4R6R7N9_9HYPH|nr:hypothetical protein [Oharaeibacter diazotrophicus]TDP82010.1 hypothetical protein EDD54_4271 [Oharaeibacter diazotrophicus]BBE73642.1 hypothetical protein OHA_1_03256 [Pleomorphomonas sp. SM30]GLS75431.1 hypothetical protein GCM10007904_07660 [Oharaeibacter diazotrophicus]